MGEIVRAGLASVPRLSGRRPLERNRLSGPLAQVRADAAYLVREGHRRGLVVTQTEVEATGDQVVLDVTYYPAPARTARPLARWRAWGWKPWTAIGAGALVAFGGCLWAVVQMIVQAALTAAQAVATGALGLLLIAAAVFLISAVGGGGGTWTGSGTWK